MIASVCVGDSGAVHSFEPHPAVFSRLHMTVKTGNFKNVKLNKLLLSDRAERMSFFLNPYGPSSSVSSSYTPTSELVEIKCDATTLDQYWRSQSESPIDLIKLDVEGYELPVLRGALDLLKSYKPLLILEIANTEGREEAFGYTLDELLSLLSELGYTFYAPRSTRLELVRDQYDLREDDYDMLCVHESGRLYESTIAFISKANRN